MIQIIQDSRPEQARHILSALKAENRANCAWLREHPAADTAQYNFLLYDGPALIGGAIGSIAYDWYFLDLLYIDAAYRGKGLGRALLHKTEAFASQRQLTGIRLETWDFQARAFYEALGFRVFGELADCPPGTRLYFMGKKMP